VYEGPYGRNLSSAGNPTLEPNIMPIGKPVAKLWPFLYIEDGRSHHLGFYRTGNSAIRSTDPEKPGQKPDIDWMHRL